MKNNDYLIILLKVNSNYLFTILDCIVTIILNIKYF